MKKPCVVKEFDSIICRPVPEDNEKYKYLSEPEFNNLLTFMQEYAGNSENADILEFMRISYKRNLGRVISVNNYVGLIQMSDGTQIEILPKIDFTENDKDNEGTKRIFLKMLKSMKEFPGKAFNESSLKADRMNLYEIFISMYLKEVRNVVKRGIKSAYIAQEDNLRYFKGKLMVSPHIKNNICHKERFYVAYDEFHPNRPENRLIKSTLNKLYKITNNSENSREIRQLLTAFELVEPSSNYEKDFSKVVIDRNMTDYDSLMKWSKVFLMDKSFTTFSGHTRARALLFPMESVYESYVAKQISKLFKPSGWDVSLQDKGHYLFTEPKKQFALRPDIVLRKGSGDDKRTVILDTKWKRIINNEHVDYGISQQDMYQMYAYSRKYDTKEIWLLYPLVNDMRKNGSIWFKSTYFGTDEVETNVRIFFVDVANDNFNELLELIECKQ